MCRTSNILRFGIRQVWGEAPAFRPDVNNASRSFPREKTYGLTSQMRSRSALISLSEHVEEVTWTACFLQIAVGSDSALEYHLLLARDLE
jgi:hypothetical protein